MIQDQKTLTVLWTLFGTGVVQFILYLRISGKINGYDETMLDRVRLLLQIPILQMSVGATVLGVHYYKVLFP